MAGGTHDKQQVSIGCWVRLCEQGGDEEEIYQIVPPAQADVLDNKIPPHVPMGRALLGACPGDQVTVHAPAGELTFEVLEVGRN